MINQQPVQNQDFSSDLLYQLKELEIQILNSQTTHSRNESVFRTFDYLLQKLKFIYRLFNQPIRFNWLQIQLEMDRLYKNDPTLTGYIFFFDFINTEAVNRGQIHFKQYLQQQQQN